MISLRGRFGTWWLVSVTPVFDVSVFCFDDDNTFFRLTEGDDEKDFIVGRNVEKLSQSVALDGCNHTAAKAHLCGSEQDALAAMP